MHRVIPQAGPTRVIGPNGHTSNAAPYPRWYNENARCDYHSDNREHSTMDSTALKRRIHNFIKAGALAFGDEDVLDINRNPLPDH